MSKAERKVGKRTQWSTLHPDGRGLQTHSLWATLLLPWTNYFCKILFITEGEGFFVSFPIHPPVHCHFKKYFERRIYLCMSVLPTFMCISQRGCEVLWNWNYIVVGHMWVLGTCWFQTQDEWLRCYLTYESRHWPPGFPAFLSS